MAGGDFFSGFDAFTLTISLPVPPAPDVIGAAAGPPPSAAARSLLSARREAAATRVGVSWRSTPPDWYRRTMHICVCACGRSSWAGQGVYILVSLPRAAASPYLSARREAAAQVCVMRGSKPRVRGWLRAYVRACVHAHVHVCVLACMCVPCAHAHMHAHAHARVHAHVHAHALRSVWGVGAVAGWVLTGREGCEVGTWATRGGVSCRMRGERYTLYPKDLASILASPPLSLRSVSVLTPLSSRARPTGTASCLPRVAYRFLARDPDVRARCSTGS